MRDCNIMGWFVSFCTLVKPNTIVRPKATSYSGASLKTKVISWVCSRGKVAVVGVPFYTLQTYDYYRGVEEFILLPFTTLPRLSLSHSLRMSCSVLTTSVKETHAFYPRIRKEGGDGSVPKIPLLGPHRHRRRWKGKL